ncbi:MAG TPA: efflux RND transporter permease subunit, partial [Gammaproteobacteria bacterium]|nr:efflux RND transporter permease subunit [Gammaproteobacteria bacterium]
MNLSAPFIRRPVATTVLMTALVLFGIFAYRSLPVSELPNVYSPTIQVFASLPGANPETMASTVATPLEREFSSISGLDSVSSVSSTGSTFITLQFNLSRNIDAAAQDVQNAISAVSRRLPKNMPSLPTLRKVNPSDYSIIYIAFTAKHMSLTKLDEFAETRVSQRLSTLPGVAQVNVWGSQKYAVRVFINPYALNARGLSLTQVADAIQSGNSNLPSGTLEGQNRTYSVQASGQLDDAEQYNNLVIAYNNGSPVHLSDVGHAVNSIEENKRQTTYNDTHAIVLSVHRQPGANTVKVAKEVRDLLPKLSKEAPGGARLHVIYDRSVFIHHSIQDVTWTLLGAIGLVIVVIFLFLRNGSATLVTALALPTSLIGTFAVMYLLGFGLDNLSLMALTLAVGFVVDDAIVVQENIVRHMEMGHKPLEAALLGSREISFTVLSMTLSLVAVFIPILFMGGLVGRLFSEFAITIAIAILLSGVVALTLTPMLSGRLLRPARTHGRLYQAGERLFDSARDAYVNSLRWSVTHWKTTLTLAVGILALSGFLFWVVPKGFIPSEDTNVIWGHIRGPEGMSFTDMLPRQKQLLDKALAIPGVRGIMSSVGQGHGGNSNQSSGFMMIGLTPRGDRSMGAEQIAQKLRRAAFQIPDLEGFFNVPPAVNIGTGGGQGNYNYILQGSDLGELQAAAEKLEKKMKAIPGIADVNTDLQLDNPQIDIHILRDKASALGVSPAAIQSTLLTAYGGQQVSTIYGSTDNYYVILELAPRYQENINALNALYVPGRGGRLVPLASIAQITPGVGPLAISHYQELPSVTLSFDLQPGVSLGSVTSRINSLAASSLPADVTGSFSGNAQVFERSLSTLPVLLILTILVIYMVLAILYEHFIHPVTILTVLPLAIFGALVALLLTNQQLDLF